MVIIKENSNIINHLMTIDRFVFGKKQLCEVVCRADNKGLTRVYWVAADKPGSIVVCI
jgi:hypothetical protein